MAQLDNPESVLTQRALSFRNHMVDMRMLVNRLEGHASRLAGIVLPPEEVQCAVSSPQPALSDDLAELVDHFKFLNERVGEILNRLDGYI